VKRSFACLSSVLALLLFVAAGLHADAPKPPVAKKVPQPATVNGDTRVDDYGWIRQKSDPAVIDYLNAENTYADAIMASTAPKQKQLYDEMLGHIKQTDSNVPYREHGWLWYSRTESGKQYPIYARKKDGTGAAEEVVIDLNKLAEGQKFMGLGAYRPSDDGNLLAYSTDNTGYRQYTLHVRDLRTGSDLESVAEKVGSVVWGADNKTIFYSVENPAKRQWRVYRHTLGGKDDPLVYEEKDDLYDLNIDRSLSGDWIFIHSDSKTTTEERVIPANDPAAAPRLLLARKEGHKYYGDQRGDRFYFLTNDAGINYRVVSAPIGEPDQKNWTEVVAYRKPVKIESIVLFANHLVAEEREGGLGQIEIVDLRTGKSHRVTFPEPTYAVFSAANHEFDTHVFRYAYQSFVTPSSTYDYDMDAKTSTLLKQVEVPGYDKALYTSERIWATASDGTKIPISVVYKKSTNPHSGKNPLWLTAYGSYGASSNATFSSARLVLLDRGVVYALAHIRGGGEMGKEWHEAGRMMTKKNTFTDFIAAAEHLVKEKYTSPSKLIVSGGSAGGLLMGAVTNMRPDLFKAVVAYVPFVDVMNTMLDPSLPLTTQEYIEWGNPNEKAAYVYMKSYDPYSNVGKKAYPNMLVRTSLNDSQVGYWEGVKWVAKLRANTTSPNPILLKVNMGAGHGGASGRYDSLKDTAFDWTWMLGQWGVTN
jgi:oligopeptidase B